MCNFPKNLCYSDQDLPYKLNFTTIYALEVCESKSKDFVLQSVKNQTKYLYFKFTCAHALLSQLRPNVSM